MVNRETWDWNNGSRAICDLGALEDRFDEVHELTASPDGERIAAPVLTAPDTFSVAVNDQRWEGEFEKAWHLAFTLSLIHISEPTRPAPLSRMPSSA